MQDENQLAVDFSASLKRWLSAAGKTQIDLSTALNVSQAAVSKWTNGTVPNAKKIPQIAAFLNITVNDLLSGQSKIILSPDVPEKARKEATGRGCKLDYKKSNNFAEKDLLRAIIETCDAVFVLAEKCKNVKSAIEKLT